MIATGYLKNPSSIGELSLLNVLHPCAIHSDSNLVFRLAGNRASVAANAPAIVDDESVFHSEELWKKNALRVSHQWR